MNRYIQSIRKGSTDIIRNRDFITSNLSFRAAMQELKREGKGNTTHYPEISQTELKLIYNSDILKLDTPVHLQNKVQFDIRLYFTRRGSENMAQMTKDTFAIKKD